MATILITGFAPFHGLPHNPSAAVLDLLPAAIAGVVLRRAVLPVDTQAVIGALAALLADTPLLAIHTGLALDRGALTIERVALNVLDFDDPDNGGHAPRDRAVSEGGPLALAARLPLRPILSAWEGAGLTGRVSNSAGTFLCNQVMYLSLSRLPASVPSGFIHLPADEALADRTSQVPLPLAAQARALELAITTALGCLG